jgi:hypothetical protein
MMHRILYTGSRSTRAIHEPNNLISRTTSPFSGRRSGNDRSGNIRSDERFRHNTDDSHVDDGCQVVFPEPAMGCGLGLRYHFVCGFEPSPSPEQPLLMSTM